MRTGIPAGPAGDFIQPFQIEGHGVRGRLVRLSGVAEAILRQHAYPESVARLLAEMMALAAALAAALKYDGIFTLQASGDGPVSMLVVDLSSAGAMRGYAQFDAARLATIEAQGAGASLPRLMGSGYLAFTVDQGPHTDRYQGIVELLGANLVECVQHYFRQSEQLQAGLKVAAEHGASGWRVGALMLQRLPPSGMSVLASEMSEDAWRRAFAMMASCSDRELLDPDLSGEDLLYRLFHEDGVRAFSAQGVEARCRCSRDRVTGMLRALAEDELKDLSVDGMIIVTCEFCNGRYDFTLEEALAARRAQDAAQARERQTP
jgi:molecular chaperone Hsp33